MNPSRADLFLFIISSVAALPQKIHYNIIIININKQDYQLQISMSRTKVWQLNKRRLFIINIILNNFK